MAERFDLVVIGAGPGGYVAAVRAAQLGMRVAIVEKEKTLGGTCLNVGCIPSKALLDSSELLYLARNRFQKHGIQVGGVELDLPRMMARKQEIVKGLTDGVAFLMRKNKITSYQGQGTLLGGGKVRVAAATPVELEAKSIILATGSEPAGLPFLPFDGVNVVGSTEALAFDRVPAHLIVIGGGYIGLELGSVWARLGSKVTVVEFLPRLLPLNDGEVAGLLHKHLSKQGLDIKLNTKVTGAKVVDRQVVVSVQSGEQTAELKGDKALLCVGRKPCITGLGLEQAGVAFDPKTNKVAVNDHYETNVAGVFAVGDLIAGPMLAHKASEEGIACVELLAGKPGHVNYNTIPSVIYTHPELAAVGLTEEQVKETGKPYKVGKFLFAANGRAKCMDDTEGMVKIITDQKSDRILGMHILGPRASDLIAEGVLGMEFSACAEDIARTCHGHPTLGEAVGEAAKAAWSMAIHA